MEYGLRLHSYLTGFGLRYRLLFPLFGLYSVLAMFLAKRNLIIVFSCGRYKSSPSCCLPAMSLSAVFSGVLALLGGDDFGRVLAVFVFQALAWWGFT